MQHYCETKPDMCPNCGSKEIAEILYGLPRRVQTKRVNIGEKIEIRLEPELEEKIKSGKVVLGGCLISDNFPAWVCNDCKTHIFKPKKIKDADG